MKSLVYPVFVSALLVSSFALCVEQRSALSTRGDEDQKVESGTKVVTLHNADIKTFIKSSKEQRVKSVKIWFEIANGGNAASEVCIYQTPLEGNVTSALMFKVADSKGEEVGYVGIQMKRPPPSKEAGNYVMLNPGRSVGTYVDLTNSFAWRSGPFKITFIGNEMLNGLPQSNTITINVIP